MMAPFHDLREDDSHAWMKKLISCGNAMEQNARLNRAYNNTMADTTVTIKKWPNASTSNSSTNTTPKKSFNKDKPLSTEHVLPAMKEKRLNENHCVKCRKTNHGSLVCRTGWK